MHPAWFGHLHRTLSSGPLQCRRTAIKPKDVYQLLGDHSHAGECRPWLERAAANHGSGHACLRRSVPTLGYMTHRARSLSNSAIAFLAVLDDYCSSPSEVGAEKSQTE